MIPVNYKYEFGIRVASSPISAAIAGLFINAHAALLFAEFCEVILTSPKTLLCRLQASECDAKNKNITEILASCII